MRKQFKGVMAVVVDEVSLCGDKLLALIESGLAALGMGDERPYSNMNILFAADFYQLRPIV